MGALRGGAKPRGEPVATVPLGRWADGGLAGSAQVSAAAPPSSGEGPFSLSTAGRGAGTPCPPTPSPGRALAAPRVSGTGSQSPRAAPKFLHSAAPEPRPSGSLSVFPHLFSSTPCKSLASARGPRAPHSPFGERSRSARRARAEGGGASTELLTAASQPGRPTRLRKGRRPPRCHLPTLPPRCVTPRSAAPARLPGTREGREGGAAAGPGSGRLGARPGAPPASGSSR